MSKAVTTSRHRADIPAKTPLSHLSDAVSANAGTIGRRGAVIAATGGLIVTMGLPASATEAHNAAPVKNHTAKTASQVDQGHPDSKGLTVAKLSAKSTKGAKSANSATPATTVGMTFKAKAAPEPAPEPEPEPATTTTQTTEDTTPATTTTSHTESTPSTTSHSSSSSSNSTSSTSTSSAPSSAKGGSIVSIAARYTGVPYVYGGTTPSGWDCSGYVSYVYRQAGISLPRSSSAIRSAGTVVSASEARPGDIIWHPGHVGIYAGNGTMYDAGSPSSGTSHRSYSWMGSVTFLRF